MYTIHNSAGPLPGVEPKTLACAVYVARALANEYVLPQNSNFKIYDEKGTLVVICTKNNTNYITK